MAEKRKLCAVEDGISEEKNNDAGFSSMVVEDSPPSMSLSEVCNEKEKSIAELKERLGALRGEKEKYLRERLSLRQRGLPFQGHRALADVKIQIDEAEKLMDTHMAREADILYLMTRERVLYATNRTNSVLTFSRPDMANYSGEIKRMSNCDDRISSLPDDILVEILSLLKDMREAARTTVLSTKWQHLWYNLPNYDFTPAIALPGFHDKPPHFKRDYCHDEKVLSKVANCVNKVVRSSRASSINTFKLHCPFIHARYTHSICEWLNFAMTKSVKELELNISGYTLGSASFHHYLPSFWRYANYPSVHTLVSLTLVGLGVANDFLESLLFNFTNLEHLTMNTLFCKDKGAKKNMKTKLVGSKLRHLEISLCHDFGEIEIWAEKLTSLVYFGLGIKFGYVPLLNDATFRGRFAYSLICNFRIISGFSSQLSRLTLQTHELEKIIQQPLEVPNQFGNLKELELIIYGYPTESLLLIANFIDACPMLHKVKLQRMLPSGDLESDLKKWNWKECRDEAGFIAMKHHHCLNIFEMVGFLGAKVDIELILMLTQEAIPLEKIILDPKQPCFGYAGEPRTDKRLDLIEIGRKEAKLLGDHIPSRVQMEVL